VSGADEVTQVNSFPKPPPSLEEAYFVDCAKHMAQLVIEVRKYNESMATKIRQDDVHWSTVQHEISGLRSSVDDFKKEVSHSLKTSDSKFDELAARVTKLEQQVQEHLLAKTG
jgi:seryl-tRNA synthetase